MMRKTRIASAKSTAMAKDILGFLITFPTKDSCFLAALDPAAAEDRVAEACRGIGARSSTPAEIGWVFFITEANDSRKTQRFGSNVRSKFEKWDLAAIHLILLVFNY